MLAGCAHYMPRCLEHYHLGTLQLSLLVALLSRYLPQVFSLHLAQLFSQFLAYVVESQTRRCASLASTYTLSPSAVSFFTSRMCVAKGRMTIEVHCFLKFNVAELRNCPTSRCQSENQSIYQFREQTANLRLAI